MKGQTVGYKKPYVSETKVTEEDFKDKERIPGPSCRTAPPPTGARNFEEINLGLTKEQAIKEAQRCLECGLPRLRRLQTDQIPRTFYELHPNAWKAATIRASSKKASSPLSATKTKCILCGLCVRVCEEVAKEGILGLVGRADSNTVIKPEFNDPKRIAVCATCQKCAQLCRRAR